MLRALRLTAAMLAGLAVPALAQAPATQPTTRPSTPPPAATTPRSATTAPSTSTPSTATTGTRPSSAASASAAAAATTGKKIDINSASEQDLDTLPGIGPAIAKNIISGRPWDDLNDLVKKKAVPQGVFDRDKERMALANINTSSAADMAKTLPGIGEVRSRAIVSGRPYASAQDLVTKKVLTEAQFEKVKDLVSY